MSILTSETINSLSGSFDSIDLGTDSLEYNLVEHNGVQVRRFSDDCLQFEDGDVCIEASVLVLVPDNGIKDITVEIGKVYLCADELEVSESQMEVLRIMIKKYLDFKF